MRREPWVAVVALGLLVGPSVAEAGVRYTAERRSVIVRAVPPGSDPFETPLREAANGLGPFDGDLEQSNQSAGRRQFARATQQSVLGPSGITGGGFIQVDADAGPVTAVSELTASFVLDAPTAYSLVVDLDYRQRKDAEGENGFVRLIRNPTSPQAYTLYGQFFVSASLDPTATFTNSGTLAPGEYQLFVGLQVPSIGNEPYDPSLGGGPVAETLAYDVTLRFDQQGGGNGGSPNPIPLPPAGWAGLATLGLIGLARGLGRHRRRPA